jgi:hypothetical protein
LIRVFVGCAASGEDAESLAVLEYTLRKNASEPVQIEFMAQSHDPASFWHGWNSERWATPFSAFRWGIPAFCKYEGRAVYTDSDVIFLGDIAELWHQPIPEGKIALAKGGGSWRLCVSLWDCEAAVLRIPPLHELKTDPQSHSKVNRAVKPYIAPFDGEWNCLDGHGFSDLSDPRLKALHYTGMRSRGSMRRGRSIGFRRRMFARTRARTSRRCSTGSWPRRTMPGSASRTTSRRSPSATTRRSLSLIIGGGPHEVPSRFRLG